MFGEQTNIESDSVWFVEIEVLLQSYRLSPTKWKKSDEGVLGRPMSRVLDVKHGVEELCTSRDH